MGRRARRAWLRVFDGGKNADAAEFADAADTLAGWRALRRTRGWQCELMVETHDSLLKPPGSSASPPALPGTAILWDAHHTWRKGGEDPVATWRAIRAAVVHVHVKDSVAVPSARHPFTYTLPGDGGFPIGRCSRRCARISRRGGEPRVGKTVARRICRRSRCAARPASGGGGSARLQPAQRCEHPIPFGAAEASRYPGLGPH